jgi:hypothetical protein
MSEIRNTQQRVDGKRYRENFDRIFQKEKEECFPHQYEVVEGGLNCEDFYQCKKCGKVYLS